MSFFPKISLHTATALLATWTSNRTLRHFFFSNTDTLFITFGKFKLTYWKEKNIFGGRKRPRVGQCKVLAKVWQMKEAISCAITLLAESRCEKVCTDWRVEEFNTGLITLRPKSASLHLPTTLWAGTRETVQIFWGCLYEEKQDSLTFAKTYIQKLFLFIGQSAKTWAVLIG